MEDVLLNLISNVGVPTAIAFYVLVRVNHNLEELTKAVNDLSHILKSR